MSLPIRTTLDDLDAVCKYLINKPIGATPAEIKSVVNKQHLDGRKLAALRLWGFIENDGNKIKITDQGRQAVKNSGASRSQVLRNVIRQITPYMAVVERVINRNEESLTATEVATHWHEHFRNEVADSEKTLNDQAVCFFRIAEGADLGSLVIGRKGMQTRFDFNADAARGFANTDSTHLGVQPDLPQDGLVNDSPGITEPSSDSAETGDVATHTAACNNRVFITHGKNKKIREQVKELITYGKFEPVISEEHETPAKPVPEKVMDDMRTCGAAVIHVSAESVLYDENQKEVPQINGNVLIEVGAAMALYHGRFILLIQEGVDLPSNLQGLYECRYEGGELDMAAAMKLLKALNKFWDESSE